MLHGSVLLGVMRRRIFDFSLVGRGCDFRLQEPAARLLEARLRCRAMRGPNTNKLARVSLLRNRDLERAASKIRRAGTLRGRLWTLRRVHRLERTHGRELLVHLGRLL